MTEINLEDFTEFSKIKNIWSDCFHDKNGLHEFLNNVVMNMDKDCNNGYGKMLPDFSDIYVLVSKKDFPFEEKANYRRIVDSSYNVSALKTVGITCEAIKSSPTSYKVKLNELNTFMEEFNRNILFDSSYNIYTTASTFTPL